jgi:hypothetical protein
MSDLMCMTISEQDFLFRRNMAIMKKNIPNVPQLLLTKLVDNVGVPRRRRGDPEAGKGIAMTSLSSPLSPCMTRIMPGCCGRM